MELNIFFNQLQLNYCANCEWHTIKDICFCGKKFDQDERIRKGDGSNKDLKILKCEYCKKPVSWDMDHLNRHKKNCSKNPNNIYENVNKKNEKLFQNVTDKNGDFICIEKKCKNVKKYQNKSIMKTHFQTHTEYLFEIQDDEKKKEEFLKLCPLFKAWFFFCGNCTLVNTLNKVCGSCQKECEDGNFIIGVKTFKI